MKHAKEWIPDTPEEWAQIGSAVNRLGILMAGIGAFEHNLLWVLITLGVQWLGHESCEYLKLHFKRKTE